MKTFTTIAAVAAFVAGIGIASAQTPQGIQAAKPRIAGTGKFCLTTKTGPKNCTFASLADCRTKAKGVKGICSENTGNAANTTGQK